MMCKKYMRLLAIVFVVVLLLTSCEGRKQDNAIDDAVLAAWEGTFSIENRKAAIKTYVSKYMPVYAGNLEGNTVSFTVDFDAVDCGFATLSPVNDAVKDGEVNTIVDFVGDVSIQDNVILVDVGWWYSAKASVKNHQQWSYLFWVKDENQVNHYYYFRVDYAK